ncbi:MAG: hypothetical protein QW607_11425 [Desulfurococcaceae archaeon]
MKFEFFFNTRRIKDLDLWMGDFIISGGRAVLDIHILINPYTGTVRGDIPLDIMSTAVILRPIAYNMTIDINVLSMTSRPMASILPIEPFIMGQMIYFRGGIEFLSIFTMSYVKIYDHARAYIEIETATAQYQSRPQFIDIEMHTLVSMPQRFESFITIDLSQSINLLQLGGIPFEVIDIDVSVSKPRLQTVMLEIESNIMPKTSMSIRPVEIIEIDYQIVWKYQGKGLGETVDIDIHANRFRSNVIVNPIVIEIKPNNPYFIRPPVVLDISQNVYWSKPGGGLNKPININTQTGPFRSHHVNKMIDIDVKSSPYRSHPTANPVNVDARTGFGYFLRPNKMIPINIAIINIMPRAPSERINIDGQLGLTRYIRSGEFLNITLRIDMKRSNANVGEIINISTGLNRHNRRTFFIYAELFQKTGPQRSAVAGEFIEPSIRIHVERQRR